MQTEIIDVSQFRQDSTFYPRIDLLLTVKSFDLQAIRKRYLASKNNTSGKTGSVERRKPGLGGVVSCQINEGKLTAQRVLAKLKEPRGIAKSESCVGIAAEDTVYLLENGSTRKIESPWFSYIHSLDFSPHKPHRILISSSGLDCIFEFDTQTLQKTYEWFAWENGFNSATDPKTNNSFFLTRNPIEADKLITSGKNVVLINDPSSQSLPTAKRAAFINSVTYHHRSENHLLATMFHKGAVYEINRKSGNAKQVIGHLKTPHGGKSHRDKYTATSTGSGEVVLGNEFVQTRFTFKNLPGKPAELGEMEWLQNSIVAGDNVITIDSNRTSFVIFNPSLRLRDSVKYDANWAVQDMIQNLPNAAIESQIKTI